MVLFLLPTPGTAPPLHVDRVGDPDDIINQLITTTVFFSCYNCVTAP